MPDHPDDVRDPQTGQYIKKVLDSETAREMTARRTAHVPARDALLEEAGYGPENPAPQSLITLAELAVNQKAGAVAAMREVLRLTGKPGDTGKQGKPGPGTICPLCGELVFTGYRPTSKDMDRAVSHIDG